VGRRASLWGAVVAIVPDLDGLVGLLFHPTRQLFIHRGFSHSIFFALLLSPLLGMAIARWNRNQRIAWYHWSVLVLLVISSHIILDFFNTYGTGILYPISNHRFGYDSMAIIDILLLIPLIAALFTLFLNTSSTKIRRLVAFGAIAYTFLYIGFSIINKNHIERVAIAELSDREIEYDRLRTAPLPLTNFLWLVLAEDSSGYHVGYLSNFDSGGIEFRYLPRREYLLDTLIDNHYVSELIRFTEGFYTISNQDVNNEGVWLYDLRYGSLAFAEWEDWYVFSFLLKYDEEGVMVSRTHPDRSFNYNNTVNYFRRVFSQAG